MPPSTRGRLSAIGRTVELVADLLAGKEVDAQGAAKLLGVEVAAATRQLKALEALPGVTRDRSGKAHIWRYTQSAASLGYDKVIAACFGSSLAPVFTGTSYHEGFNDVRQWLIERSSHRRHFGNINRKFLVLLQGSDINQAPEDSPLDDVLDALLKELTIEVEYENFAGESQAIVADPLSLLLHHHRLYLVVRLTSGGFRTLRFARIRSVNRKKRFSYPPEEAYSPQSLFQRSYGVFLTTENLGLIEFRLTDKWRVFVKTHLWHVTQESEELPEGVLVRMHVDKCPELISFLLGFGADCEVLRPKALREEIATAVVAMAERYSDRQMS